MDNKFEDRASTMFIQYREKNVKISLFLLKSQTINPSTFPQATGEWFRVTMHLKFVLIHQCSSKAET